MIEHHWKYHKMPEPLVSGDSYYTEVIPTHDRMIDQHINRFPELFRRKNPFKKFEDNVAQGKDEDEVEEENAQYYYNWFSSLPIQREYAPLPMTKPPKMAGHQEATVVGPPNKTIYTDDYGRVKIQFHWDRRGQKDEKSSCFVRVVQPLVGNGYGMQWIPRIGEVVAVKFIEGNPDEPLVICSVPTELPFPLPENQNVSGIKTETVYGQGVKNTEHKGHELSFDDTPGQEKMKLHSEGNVNIKVNNNLIETIKHNATHQSQGNVTIKVNQGGSYFKAKAIHLVVGTSRIDIDDKGVTMKADQIFVRAKGVGATQPIARVGDDHQCPKHTALTPHQGGPILKGSNFVKTNGLSTARVGDPVHCNVEQDTIKKGLIRSRSKAFR